MTSLSKQLEKLALPGRPSLKQATSRKQPSLLYSPEQAANYSTDDIYSLGCNGLSELIRTDPDVFSKYEDTLFQDSCKTFERSTQTRQVLGEVDKKLGEFLRCLSPYFLQRPAQKCLEWLIRAYQVNTCNVDALMECALPYYDTNLFARVVQLVPLKDHASEWRWLRPAKEKGREEGTPLSQLTLVQRCLSDQSFLVFICDMVPSSIRAHRDSNLNGCSKVISLYVSTVMEVFKRVGRVSEELLLRVVPYLKMGLKSRNVDYVASSYMIVCQLVCVADMRERLVESLVRQIVKSLCVSLTKEGLCCLAVLCQKQDLKRLPEKALERLIRNKDTWLPTLTSLSSSLSLSPLHSSLLLSLLDTHLGQLCPRQGGQGEGQGAGEVLMYVLDEIQLEEKVVYEVMRHLLDTVLSVCEERLKEGKKKKKFKEKLTAVTSTLTQSLADKYPLTMDKVLEDCIANICSRHSKPTTNNADSAIVNGNGLSSPTPEEEEGEEQEGAGLKLLHEFVALCLPKSRHQVLVDTESGSSLVLSMHHPNPSVRMAAVVQLGRTLKAKDKGKDADPSNSDHHFVTSSLMSRLSDEDPVVLLAVLKLGPQVLFKWLPTSDLITALSAILARKKLYKCSSDWQECALKALSLLTSKPLLERASREVVNDVIVWGIPLLFLGRNGNEFGGRVLETLCASHLVKGHPALKSLALLTNRDEWCNGCLKENYRNAGVLSAANALVFSHLGQIIASMENEGFEELVSKLVGVVNSTSTEHLQYFPLLVVIVSTLKATSLSMAAVQHHMTQQLLTHIQQHIPVLAGGVAKGRGLDLEGVFLPLVEKGGDRDLGLRLLLLWALDEISGCVLVPEVISTCMWLDVAGTAHEENDYFSLLLTLLSSLTQVMDLQLEGKGHGVVAPCKHMFQNVLKIHFSQCGSLLRFLAMIWTAPFGMEPGQLSVTGLSPSLQASCLSITCAYFKSLDAKSAVALTGNQCPVIPSLLLPLNSPYELIRERALQCLEALQDTCRPLYPDLDQTTPTNQSTPPMLLLAHSISKHKLGISMDPSHIMHILERVQSSSSTSSLPPPPPTPTRRKSRRLEVAAAGGGVARTEGGVAGGNEGGVAGGNEGGVAGGWLECVLAHVMTEGIPLYVQYQFLKVLAEVDDLTKTAALFPLVSLLTEELARDGTDEEMDTDQPNTTSDGVMLAYRIATLQLSIQTFTPKVAPSLSHHPQLLQLLLGLLERDMPALSSDHTPQLLALAQITPEFFTALGSADLQQSVLCTLVSVLLNTKHTVQVKECIAKLPLSADLVIGELNREERKLGQQPPPTPSKRRRVRPATPPADEEVGVVRTVWRRVTLVLELIQHSCHLVTDVHLLVPVLFGLLSKCFQLDEVERSGLEYTQQLILSCLLNIVHHLSSEGGDVTEFVSETQFSVELVVQCLRLSSNPHIHRHAYQLLSMAATVFPSLVLHNVMPIFTFMGSNILRRDDPYSLQVITETIDTVIPPLIKSCSVAPTKTKKKTTTKHTSKTAPTNAVAMVTEIIRTFVDAVPHIPGHRKHLLFSHLIRTMGAEDYLHVALGLLVEKQVVQSTAAGNREDRQLSCVEEQRVNTEFTVLLAQMFPPAVQILAGFKLAQYLVQLPDFKPTGVKLRQLPAASNLLFNISAHTDSQLRQFKSLTLTTLSALLSHKEFITMVASVDTSAIEENVIKFLQCMLSYITHLNKVASTASPEQKFCQSLLRKSYSVIDKITSLLSFDAFLDVISQLVVLASEEGVAGSESIQEKALEMLRVKVEKTKMSKPHDPYLLKLLDVLMGVASESSTHLPCRQVALECVRLVVKQLPSAYSKNVLKVMSVLLEMMSTADLPVPVRTSCFLCVVQTCHYLGPHLIPLLPTLLPLLLSQLGKKPSTKRHPVQLLSSATAALHSVVKTLPNFLSSFVSQILLKVCQPGAVIKDSDTSDYAKEALSLRHDMSVAIPARNLLPAYLKCYVDIVPKGKDSVLALLSMLSSTVTKLTRDDCKTHQELLLELFLTCLDYRVQQTKDTESLSTVGEVEELCLNAFTALAVKLSEAQFRVVFLKLLDWASGPSSPRQRLVTFYHLADRVADKLKGLFLLFAGHFITNMASTLDKNHSQKQGSLFFLTTTNEEEGGGSSDEDMEGDKELAVEQSCLLLGYILQCLTKCFLYDKIKFLNRERFDSLLQPLVDQVTNTIGGVEVSGLRVEQLLADCLAHFAVAAGEESLWKLLNDQLLLKTRDKSSQVRLSALKVLNTVYNRLGEEMVVLLPKTIPFLSELMEDDCEEVEQLTQSVVKMMEEVCGETIQF